MLRWSKAMSHSVSLKKKFMPRFLANRFSLGSVCAALLAAGLIGCAPMPPAQQALPQRDLAGAQLSASIKLARDGWPDAQWWSRYNDAQLNALMTQALHDAPTLQTAATRIG